MKYTVLSGGVGGSRFAEGVALAAGQKSLTVISNTGDDTEFYGLYVSPDVDIVLYTLAGIINGETGWGIQQDSFTVLSQLEALGEDIWFHVGEKDLAVHMLRTKLMKEGMAYHQVIAELAERLHVSAKVIPMSDSRVETRILSGGISYPFQEYMVKNRCEMPVEEIQLKGIEKAVPTPGVLEAIYEADAVLLAPSNPFVSIGTILALPGVRQALQKTKAKVAAVSPIIEGRTVKGPAARMLADLGKEVSCAGVLKLYRDFLDLYIVDEKDRGMEKELQKYGIPCLFTDTIMKDSRTKMQLARTVLEGCGNVKKYHM